MLKNFSLITFILALFILGISIGVFFDRLILNKAKTSPKPTAEEMQNTTQNNLYSSQTANLFGTVTEITGNLITIKNLNSGTTGTLKASDKLTISKPTTEKKLTSFSDIDLNKGALISAQLVNNEYEITTIQYFVTPSLPPLPNKTTSPSP